MKTLMHVRRHAPKFWIWTSKIMPDLWLVDLFCPIKKTSTLHFTAQWGVKNKVALNIGASKEAVLHSGNKEIIAAQWGKEENNVAQEGKQKTVLHIRARKKAVLHIGARKRAVLQCILGQKRK